MAFTIPPVRKRSGPILTAPEPIRGGGGVTKTKFASLYLRLAKLAMTVTVWDRSRLFQSCRTELSNFQIFESHFSVDFRWSSQKHSFSYSDPIYSMFNGFLWISLQLTRAHIGAYNNYPCLEIRMACTVYHWGFNTLSQKRMIKSRHNNEFISVLFLCRL